MKMVIFLVLFTPFVLWAQDANPDIGEARTRFRPITEGNVLRIGSFDILIPEGIMAAYGGDAQYMYRLMHLQDIPNCEAILFSASASWSYGISVQWIPGTEVAFQPLLSAEDFAGLWAGRDILTSKQDEVTRTIRFPFSVNEAESSAFFGYEVVGSGEHDDVVARKIYLSEEGAVVLTLTADKLQFPAYEAEILRVFEQLVQPQPYQKKEPKAGLTSYLIFFGIPLQLSPTPPAQPTPVAAESEEAPNLMLSGVVIVLALGVLGGAFFLSRKS